MSRSLAKALLEGRLPGAAARDKRRDELEDYDIEKIEAYRDVQD